MNTPTSVLPKYSPLFAFLAGASTTLAFAPFGLGPLSLLSLLLLFFLWRSASPGDAFKIGWLFGLGLMGFGVFWLHISIDQFGNVGWLLAVVITLAFVAFMALYFGFAGWLSQRLTGSAHLLVSVAVYAAIWVLSEWLRGWVLTGFPWLSLGYSQINFPLQGLAPLLGVYGISWAIALSAGLLLAILVGRRETRLIAAGVLVLLWVLSTLSSFLDWTRPAGDQLRVSLVQGNVPQEIKWEREQLGPTLNLYRDLTRAHWNSDIVIWPETAAPAFMDQIDSVFLDPLEKEAQTHATDILLGMAVRDAGDGRYFNAMISLGEVRGRYLKRHLVPFGEFLPLKSLLQPLLDWMVIPMSDFSAGNEEKPLVQLAGYPAGVSICYEDAFGEEVINALPQAAFLVNASNDAWFGDSLAPHQHMQIARMRALETGRYMLRSTNTGISAVIDPKGRITAASPAFETDVLTTTIVPMQGMTPYARVGNYAIVLLSVLSIAATLFQRRMRLRK